jgi:PEP-CTERM motif-containing protein
MAALFLAAGLFNAAPARADVVFDFSGICGEFTCSGTATGVLTLADSYVFGADINAGNFISFDYSSSDVNFEITSAEAQVLLGGLNADGSLVGILLVQVMTGAKPFFEVAPPPDGFFANSDRGEMFTFTLIGGAVPEPSTWAMMLLGFAGLRYAGYRKARLAAVAGA